MIYPATPDNYDFAATILREGDMIIYPTDTLYGLGVDATNPVAVERLNRLKNRQSPQSILLSAKEEIACYARIPAQHRELLDKLLPGPFTVLLPKCEDSEVESVTLGTALIGIRIPDHSFPLGLVQHYGRPITSTSINRHTEQPALTMDEIMKLFPQILTFRDGDICHGRPSTVVDLSEKEVRILRQGAGEFPA